MCPHQRVEFPKDGTVPFPSHATLTVPRNCSGTLQGSTCPMSTQSSKDLMSEESLECDSLHEKEFEGKALYLILLE